MKPPIETAAGVGVASSAGPGFFLLQSTDPAVAIGGNLRELSDGTVFVGSGTVPNVAVPASLKTPVGGMVVFPGATETDSAVGVQATAAGGFSVAVGADATAVGGNATALGTNATAGGNSNVAIGANAQAVGSQATAVGTGATCAVGSFNGVAVGLNSRLQGGSSVVVGASSQQLNNSFFSEAVIVGYNSVAAAGLFQTVAIGPSINNLHDNSIVIGGRLNSPFSRSLTIGFGAAANFQPFPLFGVFIGGPDTYSNYEGITYRHVNGVGVDNDVGPAQYVAPRATGSAVAGVGGLAPGLEFYTGAPGASGATLQPSTLQFALRPSAGGLGEASVEFANVTDHAGAGAGTLLNAPHAGNPDFWVPVQVVIAGVPTVGSIPFFIH